MTNNKTLTTVAALLLALFLSSCAEQGRNAIPDMADPLPSTIEDENLGSAVLVESTTTIPPATTTSLPDTAEYFEALANHEVSGQAEPGSVAELYENRLAIVDEADIYNTLSLVSSLTWDGPVARMSAPGAADIEFSDIVVSEAGVRTFNLNGTSIDHLIHTSEDVTAGSLTLTDLTTYTPAAGGFSTVVFRVTNTNESQPYFIDIYGAKFVDTNGKQSVPADSFGQVSLLAGGTASYMVAFENPNHHGSFFISAWDETTFEDTVDIEVNFG